MIPSGFLVLEDGSVFRGRSVAALGVAHGEAVFTTAMTGYQEVVTDPSYAEQLVAFTAPMVGNYGVSPSRSESARTHARAVLMRRSTGDDWPRWLVGQGIVALDEIDTRSLVLRLRRQGSMRAAVVAGPASVEEVLASVRRAAGMEGRPLVAGVSAREPYRVGKGIPVAVVDYGCKRSILTRLSACGVEATVFPHDTGADTILASRPAGVLLSNGPGDPAALPDQVAVVRDLLGRAPILGICLGHQLLALAAGFRTFKLPFGHRGANHPVLEIRTSRVLVTSQNHGFAVEGEGPAVTHVSLYDGTVEGIALQGERARSVQFHPEAGPGPHDAWPLLEAWVEELRYAAAA
jgi:carbamoyl-phosphate synthase small subunit